ncbi:zeta toxin family protein [Streptomyces sp. NPDC059385]|uniref:zeta toxin family protein n=1 Tax=Streptomyces sp. NPDC059385 TaxID=3346817 RepID=UPI003693C11D
MAGPDESVSITHQLQTYAWSNEETAAYEAAIEAVNGAVGAHSALIAAEEAKPNPDRDVVGDARTARARLAREREALCSEDREQIAAARQRYARLAREVREVREGIAGEPNEVERHRLPVAENRRIFDEGIVPELLEGRAAQATPTVVFLIGQPGSGKSRLTEMVARALDQYGGFVDVDSDLYKPYHPAYDALMARDDTLMAAYTRADGRAWMAQAEEYVRSHKLNAIIQETSQDPQAVRDKILAYRRAGARVEALFMGVPKAMSDQGIVSRYFEQLADRGQGRLTVQSNADESYRGISALADGIDDGVLADIASVYRRGESDPRYSNTLDESGGWADPPALRDALEAERNRPWTAAESEAFVTTGVRLREASRDLGPEWSERLTRIEPPKTDSPRRSQSL